VYSTLKENLKKSKNRCFACGEGNPDGLQLKFQYDPETRIASTQLRLASRYQGATGFSHGGIIATLLDEAMAKANGMAGIRAVTIKMTVAYRKMVPLLNQLHLSGWRTAKKGRKIYLRSELRDANQNLLAEARGLFLEI
jgi:acyl-coenzyme A thioesterase PaaI-like protein